MKRIYLTILLFFTFVYSCWSQILDTIVPLEKVTVCENRIQTPLAQKAASVAVITKKELAELPGLTVADKLHHVNGLDLRSRGPHGVQTDIGLRGSTFDQVLVLINGIKLNDAQTGHHVLNLPIDIESIERIEVHFGSAARVFGQNAFAGAINIITSVSDEDFIKVSAGGGDFDLRSVGLSANIATRNMKHYVSADYNESGGYKYNTDYRIFNGYYQSELNINGHAFKPMFGFTQRNFGANGFYASPDFRDQYEEVTTSLAALSYTPRLRSTDHTFSLRTYWRRNHDDYVFLRDNPAFFNNIHTNHQYGLEANSTFKTETGILGLGADVQLVDIESNNLGTRNRTVISAFVEHKFMLLDSKLSITPGVQLNNFSDFGTKFLPGIDAAYFIKQGSKIYFNSGQTFRVPTYTDLYYSDPSNFSNPNLVPETATSQEIGYSARLTKRFSGDVAIFRRRSDNLIDRIKETEDDRWTPQNISDLTHQGISVNVKYQAKETKLISSVNFGYTYLDSRINVEEGVTSRFNLENLRHQVSAGATLRYGKFFTHSVNYRYADRLNLDAYGVVDSRISFSKSKKISAFIDVSNILDIKYQETNLVIMPGRWASAGLSFKISS
ncbi:MAG: TonB-dependent receptor plug domain-containing protein [Flavobacteriales bacterium]